MRLVLAILALATGLFAADANVAGTWQGSFTRQSPRYGVAKKEPITVVLQQSGSKLSGSLTMFGKTLPLVGGTVSNLSVALTFRANTESGSMNLTLSTIHLDGTLSTTSGASLPVKLVKQP